MRQFEVYENPSPRSRDYAPYVVVLQSHHLAAIPTAVVAPLLIPAGPTYSDVSVPVAVGERDLVVSVAELAAIDARPLRRPVADLGAYEDELRRAIERVFTGF